LLTLFCQKESIYTVLFFLMAAEVDFGLLHSVYQECMKDSLNDPRIPGMVRYPVGEVVLIVLLGTLCNQKYAEGWLITSENHLEVLKTIAPFERGLPNARTLRRFMKNVSPEFLMKHVLAHTTHEARENRRLSRVVASQDPATDPAENRAEAPLPASSTDPALRHVSMDGKALRGTPTGNGTTCVTLVSAFDVKNGQTLALEAVDEKSNEIKAIPKLLEKIVTKGTVITLDAMGAQKTIMADIKDRGGEAVIGLKGNQSTLHEAAKKFRSLS
jgi:DDE_Tnp_1-associated/Transposase DDE domain